MKTLNTNIILIVLLLITACSHKKEMDVDVYETSASGNKLTKVSDFDVDQNPSEIKLFPEQEFQTILGFGGSFTEASAYLLNQLSDDKRQEVIDAYFSENGANYSLTRTHIASCDFSLNNYTYAPVPDDLELKHFSIKEDLDDLIPMIKNAQKASKDGFNIIASPWTAPPWMKDNKQYVGGKLLPEYYDTYALYFSKYLEAYKKQGIDIWGITIVNEPHGNGNNWESMHFSPEEMTNLVQHHLGSKLETDGFGNTNILGYDQNRDGLKEWVDVMYKDDISSKYYNGTAIHWYESTYEVFPEALQYAHNKAPNKYLIQTEACVDAEIPHWKDDAWYWSKEATDWGWDWAPPEHKHWHPKYVPVYRYARDIIGCLNNWVDGWVDWNMVLNRQGGPNWFKNWCVAPVIVDEDANEVYYTPIYYTLAHFSKYIRPNSKRIGFEHNDKELQVTAAKNPDGSISVVVFNPTENKKTFSLRLSETRKTISINQKAIQTIVIAPKTN